LEEVSLGNAAANGSRALQGFMRYQHAAAESIKATRGRVVASKHMHDLRIMMLMIDRGVVASKKP
jgi:hypothetical protein